jgi:4-hydroxy-tetrahydrodipicolinate synthase
MTVLSGDDSLTLPMMAVGAKGVVSVVSNIIPRQLAAMIGCALEGDYSKARKLHLKYYRLFCDLFIDTNPIPLKAAMAMMGLANEVYRLPLCPMSAKLKGQLRDSLKEAGLI